MLRGKSKLKTCVISCTSSPREAKSVAINTRTLPRTSKIKTGHFSQYIWMKCYLSVVFPAVGTYGNLFPLGLFQILVFFMGTLTCLLYTVWGTDLANSLNSQHQHSGSNLKQTIIKVKMATLNEFADKHSKDQLQVSNSGIRGGEGRERGASFPKAASLCVLITCIPPGRLLTLFFPSSEERNSGKFSQQNKKRSEKRSTNWFKRMQFG